MLLKLYEINEKLSDILLSYADTGILDFNCKFNIAFNAFLSCDFLLDFQPITDLNCRATIWVVDLLNFE